ncbi:hypothetical protein GG804_26305 [Sphingomonas histidinilytica]|uniref:hypothetical protein n=1 Tax=Rhizorhabdus histidinilytica TaxID=439228 RepID=UPI001ADA0398|nr:hypothetical protein [Rhizorhabdus histidinilytica]MBO9380282.1 hypothetical protein [Rhizorhabdus histidinilytica]
MTPHQQLIKHDPDQGRWGDCQRTCVAAILDLHPSQVPHFCDGDPARADHRPWDQQQDAWLAMWGLSAATFAYDGSMADLDMVLAWTSKQSPLVPMILTGRSRLGSNHSVVVLNGEIACDPSGNGIVGPTSEGTWEIAVISVVDPAKISLLHTGLAA